MVGAALGKEGFELLPDGLDEVRFECGHGACSFRSGSLENSPHDGASVPALHHDALPIDGSSNSRVFGVPLRGGRPALKLLARRGFQSLGGWHLISGGERERGVW